MTKTETIKSTIQFILGVAGLIILIRLDDWIKPETLRDTIHRGNSLEPASLDPNLTYSLAEANIQRDIFEGLTAEAANGAIIPGVAKTWKTSSDQLTWTFHLRKNAKWSNGDPVTAHDFVNGFRRAIDPKTKSSHGFLLRNIRNGDKILKSQEKNISTLGIKALDDYTLEIVLERPTSYFPDLLAHHVTYPFPQKLYDEYQDAWTKPENIICNGPYKLIQWIPHEHIRLVRNEYYWDQDSIKTSNIFYYPTESRSAELWDFFSNKLDTTESIPQDQIEWIQENLKESLRNTAYPGIVYYGFNMAIEPFKSNFKLRKALALSIDRKFIAENIVKLNAIPAYSWIPKGIGNYKPKDAFFASMTQSEREESAKKLFAEAGFSSASHLKLEILFNESDLSKKIAIAIAAMWKNVLGINVVLNHEPWEEYLKKTLEQKFQIAGIGGVAVLPTAKDFLERFMTDSAGENILSYSNSEFDRLVKAGINTDSIYEQNLFFSKAEKIFLQDLPAIPLYHSTTRHLVSPKIQGWIDNFMDVHPSRYLKIIPQKK